jgi:hypothetical protein
MKNIVSPLKCLTGLKRLGGNATTFAALLVGLLTVAPSAQAGSGQVLPPNATPLGYSLDDMASAVANFSISGNDLAYFPDTPFHIIYRRPGNTFTVKPGTFLYLKFFFIDDAPPVFGDFPADKSGVAEYMFGRDQLGAHDFEVEVDGKVTSLDDPGYVGGPVATPNSPDGSEHILQTGAFVTPLNKGTHTIIIRGIVDGKAFVDNVGGPFATEIVYTVIVQ